MARAQAEVAFPLTELIGIILVAVVVGGLLIFLARAVSSGNANAETASVYSMFSLANQVRDLVEKPELFAQTMMPLYLSDDVMLVGFTSGDQYQTPYYRCGGEADWIPRPSLCSDKACLCVYRNPSFGGDFKDNAPIACAQLQGVDVTLSFWYAGITNKNLFASPDQGVFAEDPEVARDTFAGVCYPWTKDTPYGALPPDIMNDNHYLQLVQYNTGNVPELRTDWTCGGDKDKSYTNEYASLVIYGQCGFEKEFTTQTAYVEKAVIDGKVHILVAAKPKTQLISAREAAFVTYAQTGLFARADEAMAKKEFGTAIALYDQYVVIARKSQWDERVIQSALGKLFEAHDANARDAKQDVKIRLASLRYVLNNYGDLLARLPANNYANTELAVLCAQKRDAPECVGVPVLARVSELNEGGACDGAIELERCGSIPEERFVCENNLWVKKSCKDCKNSYDTINGKLQVIC